MVDTVSRQARRTCHERARRLTEPVDATAVSAATSMRSTGRLTPVGSEATPRRRACAAGAGDRIPLTPIRAGSDVAKSSRTPGEALPSSQERVPRRATVALALLVPYLLMPFDLIPDFIPVLGQLDDALLVAAVVAYVVRVAGPDVVRELWPGSEDGLRAVLRLTLRADAGA